METQKKDVIRINKVSINSIPDKERKSVEYRLKKLSFFGRMMIAFGAMIYWVERVECFDGETSSVEYEFCSGFRKWHPLFLIASLISFLYHIISSVVLTIWDFFFGDKTDYFKTYRWRL